MTKTDLAAERKAQIIKATIECISRYGYNNFSMQDVARIADVSKGIIHYYFLNKEDLMMAVLERVAGDIEGLLTSVGDRTDSPTEALKMLVAICFRVVKEKREYYCINMDFWTQINQKEKVRQAIAKHYSTFRIAAANLIQQGIDVGVFKVENAANAASIIIALVDGLSLQWLFEESTFELEEISKNCQELVIQFLTTAPGSVIKGG
jgi:TetR/AcrR family fatty acid metabolism transcriptional regulator